MQRVMEVILPHPKRVWRGEPVPDWDNAITKRNISIFGAQETGKSHTARFIAQKIIEYYGKPVYALRHPDNLLGLLENLSPKHDIQVVFGEDLTGALKMLKIREQQRIAKAWFRIRHKMKEKTGRPYGLIIAIIGMHRFHGVPPAFTTENDIMIFKSVPTNPYDFNVVRRFIGDEGIRFLQMIERERVYNIDWVGYGVWWHRGEIGVWYNPKAENDPFKLLEVKKEEETETWKRSYRQVDASGLTFEEYMVERARAEFGAEIAEMLQMRLEGASNDEIGERFGLAHNTVSEKLKPIREKRLGFWFEDYFSLAHGLEPKPDNQKIRPEPDLIVDGVIYSLKSYMQKRNSITIDPREECKPEIAEAEKRGSTFRLVLNNPLWHETHMVTVNPKNLRTITFKRGDKSTLWFLPKPRQKENPTTPNLSFPETAAGRVATPPHGKQKPENKKGRVGLVRGREA